MVLIPNYLCYSPGVEKFVLYTIQNYAICVYSFLETYYSSFQVGEDLYESDIFQIQSLGLFQDELRISLEDRDS